MSGIINALFGGQPENLEYAGYTDCPLCGDDCAEVWRDEADGKEYTCCPFIGCDGWGKLVELRGEGGERMSDLMRICDNCGYFGPQIDHGQEIECEDDGACRKNPPTILPMGEDGGFAAIFPPVNREDWCGGWKAVKR